MKRLLRLTFFGLVTFAICAVVLAPASLIRLAARDAQPVTIGALTGTLWRGGGDLGFDGTPLGRLNWSLVPALLLKGQLGFDVDLRGDRLDVAGTVAAAPSAAIAHVHGRLDTALLEELMARYAIEVPGTLEVEDLDVTHDYHSRLPVLHGALKWPGGTVKYRLQGRDQRVALPPLVGQLDSATGEPTLTVSETGATTPLLIGHLTQDGVASIGITKQFTKILGQPWPGSEPDHAVVLEVGEKLF